MDSSSDRPRPPRTRTPHERTLHERRRFYELALRFQQAAPWTWTSEFHVFGVRRAGADEPDWCSIVGDDGGAPGLHVHLGSRGLGVLESVLAGAVDADDLTAEQDLLVLSFELAGDVTIEERRDADATELPFDRDVGLPCAMRHVDGRHRTRLDADELERLNAAIEQSIEVTRRVRDESLDVTRDAHERRFARVETVADGRSTWSDARVAAVAPRPESAPAVDAAKVDALLALPLDPAGVWEVEAFAWPFDEPARNGATLTPFVCAVADSIASTILLDVDTTPDRRFADARDAFVLALRRAGGRPARVLVARAGVEAALAPWTTALGLALERVDELPTIDAWRDEVAADETESA